MALVAVVVAVAAVVAAAAEVVAAAAAVVAVLFLSVLPTVTYQVKLAKVKPSPIHSSGEVKGSPSRKDEPTNVLRSLNGCWAVWPEGPRARIAWTC